MSLHAQPHVAAAVVSYNLPSVVPDDASGAEWRDPLLVTKLVPGAARTEHVARPGIVARLNAGLRGKLTLVSAPAGYGKTSLLAEWAAECTLPVAWVALDEGDSDPARFWSYVIAALRALLPDVHARAERADQGGTGAAQEPAIAALINTLAGTTERAVLVLDDYHLVESDAVQRGVSFLIDYLPPQLHVVIACRADPPLPLPRWRSKGWLNELRAADLRFSPVEAHELIARFVQQPLDAADVIALDERTEGWPAGLTLAALALRERGDISRFIAAFNGSHRSVVDYLIDEVVEHLPAEVQEFLMMTAILDRFSGPLCDAITGREDSQGLLEHLERANLFLIPLDDERRWFRYHVLLSDVLRHRLRANARIDQAGLHARAAEWFAAHSHMSEAVRHAIAARAWDTVAELVRLAGGTLLTRGEFSTLLGWIGQVPEEIVRTRSSLCRIRAWALVFTGRLNDAESALEDVAACVGGDPPPGITSEVAAIQACIARFRGDIQASLHLTQVALEHAAEQDLLLYGVVLVNLAAAQGTVGEFDAAYRSLDAAERLAARTGDHLAVLAHSHRGRLLAIQGRLREAGGYYQRALQLGGDGNSPSFPAASYAAIGVGAVWYQWNQLDNAAQALADGITLSGGGRLDLVVSGLLTLARTNWARGERATARNLVEQARDISHRFGVPHISEMIAGFDAWLALCEGNIAAAQRWAEHLPPSGPLTYRAEQTQLVLARLALATGRYDAAIEYLQQVEASTTESNRAGHRIEALVVKAQVLQRAGALGPALVALRAALELGEPEGYQRVFLDEGRAVAVLLNGLRAEQALPEHLVRHAVLLLDAFAAEDVRPAIETDVLTDANQLTRRELEVLGKLAAGLSNREIADCLYVSIGTVKRHTNSIYGKLGVNTRGRAVALARERQIIAL